MTTEIQQRRTTATLSFEGKTLEMPVIQGSEGVLTSGTFSASHVYTSGGIFTAVVTVKDDDGGSHSAVGRRDRPRDRSAPSSPDGRSR